MREWMRRIDCQRRQHRKHLTLEVLSACRALRWRQFVVIKHMNALLMQLRLDVVEPAGPMLLKKRNNGAANGVQLFRWGQPVR
jgi:hypothetical protein